MRKRAVLGKALAVVALSASLAGVTTGSASAKPWDGPDCVNLHSAYSSWYDVAATYLSIGYMRQYRAATAAGDAAYDRYIRADCG